jgi:hypothetical protein
MHPAHPNPVLIAEETISDEILELGTWLAAQGIDVEEPPNHAHAGSRDRLHWRYGYFCGLKQALERLSSRGATLH